jgi:hypothetical protein
MEIKDIRYPIGRLELPEKINDRILQGWIGDIEAFPASLASAVQGLEDEQLGWTYREGGWTIRQVVH